MHFHVRQNFAGRILNYGHVYVETAGTSGAIALKYVNDPAGWAHALYEQRQTAPLTLASAESTLSGDLPRRGYVAPHPPTAPGHSLTFGSTPEGVDNPKVEWPGPVAMRAASRLDPREYVAIGA